MTDLIRRICAEHADWVEWMIEQGGVPVPTESFRNSLFLELGFSSTSEAASFDLIASIAYPKLPWPNCADS